MSDRDSVIAAFLAAGTWRDWARQPLAADASSRRYSRLTQADQSVILMDAPPASNGNTQRFAEIAGCLAAQDLAPPEILLADHDQGLMVITDLGATDVAKWTDRHPEDERAVYRTAVDVLVALDRHIPDLALDHLTPAVAGDMLQMLSPFYTSKSVQDLAVEMTRHFDTLAPVADTMALRDYHAENLIWRAKENGLRRIGLLDFQDAFLAPSGYDLMSLVRDVRRTVAPARVDDLCNYFREKTGAPQDFDSQLACLGAQRNLRILGVFARLAKNQGKPRYLRFLPRVWAQLALDLAHPQLSRLREAVQDTLPPPHVAIPEASHE